MVVVGDVLRGRIVVERVDGEIAPQRVFFLRAVNVVGENAAMFVGRYVLGITMRAEGRHLDHFAADHHVHDLEAPADDARAAELTAHFFGGRAGGDVEILGCLFRQQVAHRATYYEGLKSGFLQYRAHLACGVRDLFGDKAVRAHGDERRFAVVAGLGAAQNPAQQFANHRSRLFFVFNAG